MGETGNTPVGWFGRSFEENTRFPSTCVIVKRDGHMTDPLTTAFAVRSKVPSFLIQGPLASPCVNRCAG